MNTPLSFRWLGVQGIELSCDGQVLVIDPFFTRPPLEALLFKRLQPDEALTERMVPACNFILVTHAHYDHVMDVPGLARRCKAEVYGSANTGALLAISGVPGAQFHEIRDGNHFSLGPFEVDVFSSQHVHFPLDSLLAGPMRENLRLPLRLLDYRIDRVHGFLIFVRGVRILFHPGLALPADVVFAGVTGDRDYYRHLLSLASPRLFVPLHWDNFFRPLNEPPRELLYPGRMSLKRLKRLLAQTAPGTRFIVPEIMKPLMVENFDWK